MTLDEIANRSFERVMVVCQTEDKKELQFFTHDGKLDHTEKYDTPIVVGAIGYSLARFDGLNITLSGPTDFTYKFAKKIPVEKAFFPGTGESNIWFYDGLKLISISMLKKAIDWEYEVSGMGESVGNFIYPYDQDTCQLVKTNNKDYSFKFVNFSKNKFEFCESIGSGHAIAGFHEGDKIRLFYINIVNNGYSNINLIDRELEPIKAKLLYFKRLGYDFNSLQMVTDKGVYLISSR